MCQGNDSVIECVEKIAFQTRVLAMNAAVEAGRTGDAGRGFAVVADLVSALAQRAEEEAKRARDQVTVTQGEIAVAVDAVARVDQAFNDIIDDVGIVHALLGTIAHDNRAQSGVVTEITAAVSSMDRTQQQNAAMVEETSAAARNLTNDVDALAEQTARFTVADGIPHGSRRAVHYLQPGPKAKAQHGSRASVALAGNQRPTRRATPAPMPAREDRG